MGWVVSITPWPRFTSGERSPGTHWAGGWVGSRAGPDTEARGKILSPLPRIEPRTPSRPAPSQTLYWLSYPDWLYYTTIVHENCTRCNNSRCLHTSVYTLLHYRCVGEVAVSSRRTHEMSDLFIVSRRGCKGEKAAREFLISALDVGHP
jgi:hypothetical protein